MANRNRGWMHWKGKKDFLLFFNITIFLKTRANPTLNCNKVGHRCRRHSFVYEHCWVIKVLLDQQVTFCVTPNSTKETSENKQKLWVERSNNKESNFVQKWIFQWQKHIYVHLKAYFKVIWWQLCLEHLLIWLYYGANNS